MGGRLKDNTKPALTKVEAKVYAELHKNVLTFYKLGLVLPLPIVYLCITVTNPAPP